MRRDDPRLSRSQRDGQRPPPHEVGSPQSPTPIGLRTTPASREWWPTCSCAGGTSGPDGLTRGCSGSRSRFSRRALTATIRPKPDIDSAAVSGRRVGRRRRTRPQRSATRSRCSRPPSPGSAASCAARPGRSSTRSASPRIRPHQDQAARATAQPVCRRRRRGRVRRAGACVGHARHDCLSLGAVRRHLVAAKRGLEDENQMSLSSGFDLSIVVDRPSKECSV